MGADAAMAPSSKCGYLSLIQAASMPLTKQRANMMQETEQTEVNSQPDSRQPGQPAAVNMQTVPVILETWKLLLFFL